MWYAGIDWADTHHVIVVINEQGQQVATKQVAHTVEGLAQLTTFLLGIVETPQRQEELACSIETSHGLLIAALTSGRLSRLPGQSQNGRSPPQTRRSQNGCYRCLPVGKNWTQRLR